MPSGLRHLLILFLPFLLGSVLFDVFGHSNKEGFSLKVLIEGFTKGNPNDVLIHNWLHSLECWLVITMFWLGFTFHLIHDFFHQYKLDDIMKAILNK